MTDIATKHPERTLLSSLTGTVMVPGDVVVDFAHMPAGSVLRVGRGLQQDGQKLVAVQAGRLCCVLGKSKLWIEAPQKRAATNSASLMANGSAAVAATEEEEAEAPLWECSECGGSGWLICDFCNGQKVNVQIRANKFYRRCPTCRAVGVLLCGTCRVFKCVTFPDASDSSSNSSPPPACT
eukprot:TRINITY_DN13222_c0_g1_i3.p1 TRINITY_DN13222_c0_g1~~TRINITY_DN13222_c0_g1_i3.p1  ORF type:complete len:205 (-),score=60.76 TRINITY_DN13222_c0_g1_i3:193-735(-)